MKRLLTLTSLWFITWLIFLLYSNNVQFYGISYSRTLDGYPPSVKTGQQLYIKSKKTRKSK